MKLAERKIQEAIRNGEFDDLLMKGQPLPKEDLPNVPEELRMGYKILKNAGIAPEEVVLNRELTSLRGQLIACTEPEQREELRKLLGQKQLRYDMLMERNMKSTAFHHYAVRIRNKLGA